MFILSGMQYPVIAKAMYGTNIFVPMQDLLKIILNYPKFPL
jgi:hypothetical protein